MNKEIKIVFAILILVILFVSLFYFILQQNNEQIEEPFTGPVGSFSLTINDLTGGYIRSYENDTLQGGAFGVIERYEAGFIKNTSGFENDTNVNVISFTISKFESITSAKTEYPQTVDAFKAINSTLLENYENIIGDESTVFCYEEIFVVVVFRFRNILVILVSKDFSGELNASSLVGYAKIIEERINVS